MAHAIAAENRIVSLLATCYQNQIESVLTCRASYRVALLDKDSVAQQASPGPPLPFYSILDDVTVICISRVVLSFRDNLGPKKHQGPAPGLLSPPTVTKAPLTSSPASSFNSNSAFPERAKCCRCLQAPAINEATILSSPIETSLILQGNCGSEFVCSIVIISMPSSMINTSARRI